MPEGGATTLRITARIVICNFWTFLIFLEHPGDEDVAVKAGPHAGADEPVLELASHGCVVHGPRLRE